MGLGAEHERLRLVVLERDEHTCHWCGGPADQADHVIARAVGGPTTLDNLVAACGPCNARRGAELGEQLRRSGPTHPFFY